MKAQWRFGVHVPRWAVVFWLMMGAVGWTAEADALSGRATVKRDGVSLYAQMATTSEVLSVLARDAIVQVDFAILNAQGHWCRVKEEASQRSAGYVRCDDLEPGPPARGQPNVVRQEKQQGVPGPAVETVAREARWHLSREDAQKLEDGLKSDPDDLSARTRLLGYYFGPLFRLESLGPSGRAATIEARRRHILWIIQHRPDAEVAGLPEATIDPQGHPLADKAGYRQARALWRTQAERYKSNTAVLGNAAKYFQLHDKVLAEDLLKQARALDPSNPVWTFRLGYLYGLGIMGVNGLVGTSIMGGIPTSVDPSQAARDFAKKARAELQQSSDAILIGTAGAFLRFMGFLVWKRGMSTHDYARLAEELINRAKALKPEPLKPEPLDEASSTKDLLASYTMGRMGITLTLGRPASPQERREFAKMEPELRRKLLAAVTDDETRFYILKEVARGAFDAGDVNKAEAVANELLDLASRHRNEEKYGAAVHDGNMILGRVAVRRGDIEKAKTYLIRAGNAPAGPGLGGFGPNMSLAKDLLEKGERETVLEYLELCKRFWRYPRKPLERWIQTIKSGGTPQFGSNLIY